MFGRVFYQLKLKSHGKNHEKMIKNWIGFEGTMARGHQRPLTSVRYGGQSKPPYVLNCPETDLLNHIFVGNHSSLPCLVLEE